MKTPITRETKVKLLKAIKDGVFDSKDFPELTFQQLPTVINIIEDNGKRQKDGFLSD